MYMYVRPRFENLITIERRSWEFNVSKTYQLEQRERETERMRERVIQLLLCTDCAHRYSWLSIQVEEIMSIVFVLSVLLPIGAGPERTDEEGSR